MRLEGQKSVREQGEDFLLALQERPPTTPEEVVWLSRFKDRLEAPLAQGVREIDKRKSWAAEGATSLPSWLRWRCRLLPGQAIERAALSRQLEELPETAVALSEGRIGYPHAAELARTAESIGAEPVRRQEAVLIEAARDMDPHQFRVVTRHLRYCENPDGTLKEENENHELRWLHLSQSWNGVFHLEGRLDAEGGAVLQSALDSYTQGDLLRERLRPSQRRASGWGPHAVVASGEWRGSARAGRSRT